MLAVRDVDLALRAGEITAVMGPSGSGKSTLLHVMSGLLEPTSGRVEIGGRALGDLSESERARLRATEIGYVLQRDNLLAPLTLQENVAAPLMLAGVGRRDALARATAALADVGLDKRAEHLPAEVSGGEAVRTALARALVVEPRIVFADEPTGALDSVASVQVLDTLVTHVHERGAAAFVVTHDRDVADRADRVVTMRDGTIVEDGSGVR